MNAESSHLSDQFWEPGRDLTLAAAQRHTQFIAMLRWVCLGLACALFFALVYFIIDGPGIEIGGEAASADTVRMTNPRYTGVDGDGEPYSLTADYAVREVGNPNAVRLVSPVLNFLRESGAGASNVIAKEGIYNNQAQTLELTVDVTVSTDDGYVCDTSHALIHTQTKTVEGNTPIECSGNFGNVEGDRYEILNNYSRFVFLDNVSALLLPEPQNELGFEQIITEDTP